MPLDAAEFGLVPATQSGSDSGVGIATVAPGSLPDIPGQPPINLPTLPGPPAPTVIDVGGARAVPASKAPKLDAADFGLVPAPPAPAPAAPQITGIAREVALPASALASGLVQTLGTPGDIVRGIGALGGASAASEMQGNPMPATFNPPGMHTAGLFTPQQIATAPGKETVTPLSGNNPLSSESLLALTNAAGVTNRPDLAPQTPREKMEAAAAGGVGMMLPTIATGGLSDIPAALRLARAGAGMGVGSEAGGDIGQAIGGTPGRVIGSTIGGIASPVAGAVAARGWQALAPQVLPPIAGSGVPVAAPAAANAMAARAFSGANVTPEEAALLANPPQLVPGSPVTSFQVTGNQNLGAMEKGAAALPQNKSLFTAARNKQTAAQLAHIQRQAPSIGPGDVVPWFKGKLAQMRADEEAETGAGRRAVQGAVEAAGQPATAHEAGGVVRGAVEGARAPVVAESDAAIAAADQAAQEQTAALGGEVPAGADERSNVLQIFGRHTRGELNARNQAERVQVSRLFDTVDPDGTLAVNMNAIRSAARKIAKEMPKNAKKMEGEEAAIFGTAQMQPKVQPFNELKELRSRITDKLREELYENGRTVSYRRLTQLLGAVDDTLSNGVEEALAKDSGLAERLAAMAREEGYGPAAGTGDRTGVAEGFAEGPPGVLGAGGGEGAAGTGSGDVGGNRSVETEGTTSHLPDDLTDDERELYRALGAMPEEEREKLIANFTPEAAARYRAANAAHASRVQRFEEAPGVGNVLASGKRPGDWKLGDALVPSSIFRSGPAGAETADALIKATGSPEAALQALGEYPAFSLRSAAEKIGTLSVPDYEKWLKNFGPFLDKFPELTARFDTAAKARAALDDIRTQRAALDAANPIRPGWGDADIMTNFVKPGPQGYENAGKLVEATAGSPTAAAATRDYLANILRTAAEIKSGPNAGTLDAGAYQRFMRQYDSFLSHPAMADTRAAFETAGKAQAELDASAAAHKDALDAYQASAAKHFLGPEADPVTAVEKILDSGSAPQQMADLARQTANDPAAREGIQAAVIRAMLRKVETNNPIGADLEATTARSEATQKFVEKHVNRDDGALRAIMTPEQLDALRNVALDMRRGNRAIASGRNTEGSPTAFLTSARQAGEHKPGVAGTLAVLETLGEAGQEAMGHTGRIGAMLLVPIIQAAKARGYRSINDLVTQALLHPRELSSLLADVPTEGSVGSRLAAIKTQLATMAAMSASRGAQADQPERRVAR